LKISLCPKSLADSHFAGLLQKLKRKFHENLWLNPYSICLSRKFLLAKSTTPGATLLLKLTWPQKEEFSGLLYPPEHLLVNFKNIFYHYFFVQIHQILYLVTMGKRLVLYELSTYVFWLINCEMSNDFTKIIFLFLILEISNYPKFNYWQGCCTLRSIYW
jgi:hypothetical protein